MGCFCCLLGKSRDKVSSLYREAVKVTQEGRYVVSEIIFHRIIQEHPAYEFWMKVHEKVRQRSPNEEPPNEDQDILGVNIEGPSTSTHETIELTFDNQVVQVVDFIRLCMDIAHVYINQPADEYNGRLAMIHYAFAINYLLEFFHLMMLWRSEVGEGLMTQSNRDNTFGDKVFATPLDIMRIFRCLKHTIIFYFMSASLNYIVLSLQYIHHLDKSKGGLKARVLSNCLELTDMAHLIVKWTVLTMPESITARHLIQNMPCVGSNLYEDDEEDEKSSVHKPSSSSSKTKASSVEEGWATLLDKFSGSRGDETFFGYAKRVNPEMRIVRELQKSPHVRLNIATKIFRHHLARIETPPERNSFHYISWFFAEDVSVMPGQSAHYLALELPQMFGPNGKHNLRQVLGDCMDHHTSLKIKPKVSDTSAVFFKSEVTNRPLTAFETNETACKQKTCARVLGNLRRYLDLTEFNILTVVGLEELLLVGSPMLVISTCLLEEMGQHKRAKEYSSLLDINSGMMYGLNSPEHKFLSSLRELCTVRL